MANDQMDALFNAAGPVGSDQSLSRIRQLIAEESDMRAEKATAEAMLENAKSRSREIRHTLLPQAMLDAGVREFVADDGTKAKITFVTDGSLGPANTPEEFAAREAKLDCIIEYGGGEIVKQMVLLEFPKEMVEEAESFRQWCDKEMKKRKWNVAVSRSRSVHHMTLSGWIKERMSSGDAADQLPQDFFDRTELWYGEAAKVTPPKKKS